MSNPSIFFNGWDILWRTLVSCLCVYLTMVALLRISGKRTLSQMTPFDMIIPMTLGPILASTILLAGVTIFQGLLAFSFLIALHKIMAWLSMRFEKVRSLVVPEPTLLLHQGVLLREVMRQEHVTESEILKAIRARGFSSVKEVEAVVLEGDGGYNVISRSPSMQTTSLENVNGYPGKDH